MLTTGYTTAEYVIRRVRTQCGKALYGHSVAKYWHSVAKYCANIQRCVLKLGDHSLLCLALGRYRLDRLPDSLLVSQELHGNHRLQIFVEFVDKWNPGGKIETHDGIVRHTVQVFHNSSQ